MLLHGGKAGTIPGIPESIHLRYNGYPPRSNACGQGKRCDAL